MIEPMNEFADYRDRAGRYVRHWRHGSGHGRLMEISEDPEAFDPPFGSGDVLVRIQAGQVTVYALSEEHYRQAVRKLACAMIHEEAFSGVLGDL